MKLKNLRYLNLLVVIIVMMVISPFVQRYPSMRIINGLVLTLVMLSVVNTVRGRKVSLAVGLLLGVPWLVIAWLNGTGVISVHPAVPALLSLLFDGYIIFILLGHIVRAKRVEADIIYGAISVYILLGLFFTAIYHFLGSVYGQGLFIYAGAAGPRTGVSMGDLYYFSYVTLTTLGYGDIQPVSEMARAFSIIEAMTGVLYSAVLIGRLIGMYVAQYGSSEAFAEATSKAREDGGADR